MALRRDPRMDKTILKWFEILEFPTEWRKDIESAAKTFDFAKIDSLESPYSSLFDMEDKMQDD